MLGIAIIVALSSSLLKLVSPIVRFLDLLRDNPRKYFKKDILLQSIILIPLLRWTKQWRRISESSCKHACQLLRGMDALAEGIRNKYQVNS